MSAGEKVRSPYAGGSTVCYNKYSHNKTFQNSNRCKPSSFVRSFSYCNSGGEYEALNQY